jgi:hypothetical protein
MTLHILLRPLALGAALLATLPAWANPILAWNEVAFKAVVDTRQSPVNGVRAMAVVHAAMFDAVNAIEPKYQRFKFNGTVPAGASADAAAAAAAYTVLAKMFPDQRNAFEAALTADLAKVAQAPARDAGRAVGAAAAQTLLDWCADDGFGKPTQYRPFTTAGVYVMTTLPASHDTAAARPMLMSRADQFRPAPPPTLKSAIWERDYEETRRVGARSSAMRTAEQTQVAQFWVVTGAPAFNGIMRQTIPQRAPGTVDSARLFALTYLAFTDALIGVFEAKYTYNFWRPITAVRNGDLHETMVIKREPGWLPLVDAPLHPEYPCAHCISSATVVTMLQSAGGDAVQPVTMTSPTLPGVTRRWDKLSDVMLEVSNARIWSGVHYRNSTEVGQQMGSSIARYALDNYMRPR